MPVSVELQVDKRFISPSMWGLLGVTLTFYIRTQGREAKVKATFKELFHGAIAFFDELPKYRSSAKRVKQVSMNQERRSAEALGGRRQSGSGARAGYKGDGRVRGRFRIENKFTTATAHRVKLSELRKIRSECEGLEVPVYDIEFQEKVTHTPIDNWVLVPRYHWETLANAQAGDD